MNFLKILKTEYWVLKKYEKILNKVLEEWKKISELENEDFKYKTQEFKKRINKNETFEDILPEAFAVVCEIIYRVKGFKLHNVQILGSIALNKGNVAEMKTGEGKTLTALLPAYLNTLKGEPVYIVTVNEYLVKRDKENNETIFNYLGIRCGNVFSKMNFETKKNEYLKDVIYITNSELGFDYLRDNMKKTINQKVQRTLAYIIIDEVDSILIDEAQTPLVISGKPKSRSNLYKNVDTFIKTLQRNNYDIDKETKKCFLNKRGIHKTEVYFKLDNLFSMSNSELNHFLNNSLYANFILEKNIDYVVRKNKILLVDKFTGRIMEGRSLSEGLHQALEAKEDCEIKDETSIMATITYQNLFRLFSKISGMTGTAIDEKEEFFKIYNMFVISIPTNLPIIRKDLSDLIFYSKTQKYISVTNKITELFKKGRPVLVGTNSLEISEEISLILRKLKIPHQILNAKRHEYEALIIKNAGKYKTITIATNMAGRGTDIKLEEKTIELGGLVVLSLGRNDSRRIDLQLMGRSGRQGEPGMSRFYLSLDDDLFKRFGGDKLKIMFSNSKNDVLSSKFLTKIIKKAQEKLQNLSFEQRKSLLEFDNIISQQRRVVYKQRDFLMRVKNFNTFIFRIFNHFLKNDLKEKLTSKITVEWNQLKNLFKIYKESKMFLENQKLDIKGPVTLDMMETKELFLKYFKNNWKWFNDIDQERVKKIIVDIISKIILDSVDKYWVEHLDEILKIKSSSFLQSYAQKRPLQMFIEESEFLFSIFKDKVAKESIFKILNSLNYIYIKTMEVEKKINIFEEDPIKLKIQIKEELKKRLIEPKKNLIEKFKMKNSKIKLNKK